MMMAQRKNSPSHRKLILKMSEFNSVLPFNRVTIVRFLIVAASFMLVSLSGCERHVPTREPDPIENDLPKPINVHARLEDRQVTLTWQTNDSSGIAKFRIYVSDSTDVDFRLIDSTTGLAFTKTVPDFGKTGVQFFRVVAVSPGGAEGERSDPIGARIAFMSISVNDDAEFTNSRDVNVTVDAPLVVTHIMISEDSNMVGATFKPFSGSAPFKLSDSDGVKRVYARLEFEDGNESGVLKSDSIIVDTRAAIDSVKFTASDSPIRPGVTITFFIYAREAGGQAGVSSANMPEIELFDKGQDGDVTANDGVYSANWVVPINTTINNGIIAGDFVDRAGNNATQKQATQTLNVFSPPLPVTAAAFALSTFQIQLTWTASESQSFTAYRIYRSLTPNVTTASQLLISIDDQGQSNFIDSTLADNTTAYYKVFVYDNTGLSSGSNEVSAQTQVNVAPQQIEFFAVKNADSTVSLTWAASPDVDFSSYRIYRANNGTITTASELVAFITDVSTTEFTAEFLDPPVQTFFRIFVFDRHGLSTGSVVRSVTP
jgi:fibronectin type 3 domain-containing protein